MNPALTPAYDPVAELYDRAFADIRVRRSEWRWVQASLRRLPAPPRVLDVGSGTGALLRAMAPQIAEGVGIDVSLGMLERARQHASGSQKLSFIHAPAPTLPFEPRSFDVVISFLSFRYLDWGSILSEVRRVLAPGGRFWMIDLVSALATPSELPALARAGLRQLTLPFYAPRFARDLAALTKHPDWSAMLQRHPIRALTDYQRLLLTEFPGRKLELLDATRTKRIVAFDSGSLWP